MPDRRGPLAIELDRRLRVARHGTAGSDLLSFSLRLDPPAAGWTETADCFVLARPASGIHRIGLGTALAVDSAGPGRFAALRAAHAGLARSWRHDRGDAPEARGLAFLGFAFAPDGGDALPSARLAVPAVLLDTGGGRPTATFSCTAGDADGAVDHWLALLAASAPPRPALPAAPARVDHPLADRAWFARAGALIGAIAAGELDKAVLARHARLTADRDIPVAAVLAALGARNPDCLTYGFRLGGPAFVGATPERLVALTDGRVSADALAGTAWGPPDDVRAPLATDKNRREQRLVADAVRDALAPLCAGLDTPAEPEVMHLPGLAHLRSRFTGRAEPGVGLIDLVARLHPTPAVGGFPTAAALDWLKRHGDERRGWYAGGVGWIDEHGDGEIGVALRCALIDGASAELQAGAGLVAGSDPETEFAETEAKLAVIAEAIREACAGTAQSRTA